MKNEMETIEYGTRVCTIDGPGQFPLDGLCGRIGTVIDNVTDRWGDHLVVYMDNGSIDRCHGLSKIGCGWYLLEKLEGK